MKSSKTIVITGGAGFIGSNAAVRFLDNGYEVVVVDDLSRRGSEVNLEWIRSRGDVRFVQLDIRFRRSVDNLMKTFSHADVVLHLAGQTAVTTSVQSPRDDFESNLLGTFNLLEAVRAYAPGALFMNAATNKVYGDLQDVGVYLDNQRYQYIDYIHGIPESVGVDFHSPYGCSKGGAEQYVLDYARIYGLHTVSFRQSCIYGTRQFGIEDQGWVAWFTLAHLFRFPLTLFGDGYQVRDILFIDDLVDAYELVIANRDVVRGQAFNVGGGADNQVSLRELVDYVGDLSGYDLAILSEDERPGDQKVFVADTTKLQQAVGWEPRIDWQDGVRQMYDWMSEYKEVLEPYIRTVLDEKGIRASEYDQLQKMKIVAL